MSRRSNWRRHGGIAFSLLIAAFILGSCQVRWPFDRPIPIGPSRTGFGGDSTEVASDTIIDSAAVALESPKRPPVVRPARPDTVLKPSTLPPDSTLAGEEPDTVETGITISLDRPQEQEEQLRQEVVSNLARATALVEAAASRVRTPEDREKIETVRGLIEQAQAALGRGDQQAAANLSHKARLLAAELPNR
jgi:hypothetical protein